MMTPKEELELEVEAVLSVYSECAHAGWTENGWRFVSLVIEQELVESVKVGLIGCNLPVDLEHSVHLTIKFSPDYPKTLPVIEITGSTVLSKEQVQSLYWRFLEFLEKAHLEGEPSLLQGIELVRDQVRFAIIKRAGSDMLSSTPFRIARGCAVIMWFIQTCDRDTMSDDCSAEVSRLIKLAPQYSVQKWPSCPKGIEQWVNAGDDRGNFGIDEEPISFQTRTCFFKQSCFLKQSSVVEYASITDVLGEMQRHNIGVGRIETIMRSDLENDFRLSFGPTFKTQSWEILFHGTASANAERITRHGLIQGGKRGVQIINGASYGHGVYVAKDPQMARSYGDTIIVAVASKNVLEKGNGYDKGHFYVIPDSKDILPLYIIEVASYGENELRVTNAGTIFSVESQAKRDETLETLRQKESEEKQAALANASFFIDTSRFLVLDAAPYDEDDDTELTYEMIKDNKLLLSYGVDDDKAVLSASCDRPMEWSDIQQSRFSLESLLPDD